jgi:arabinogalactan endo-1,4-beta-galactosidase
MTINRIALISLTAVAMLGLAMGQANAAKADPHSRTLPFLRGADLSLLAAEEDHGTAYRQADGQAMPLLKILKRDGYNCVRLRLWVNPSGQGAEINNLAYTVALGKRVKQAGLMLLVDIQYSDTWADPGRQTKPAAWADLPFDALTRQVRDYATSVIQTMRAAGAMPDIVQIGNEIPGGMLWPDGKDWGPGHDFTNLGRLLKAAIGGIEEGRGAAPAPFIMIHIDRGADWSGTKWFFDGIVAQGVPFDLIGESYYPFTHGPLSAVKETLAGAARRYGKPIVVVETAYPYLPWSQSGFGSDEGGAFEFPLTPDGQARYLGALLDAVRATPDGLGQGVFYWQPEWIPVNGLPSTWEGKTLFSDDGKALPGLAVLGGGALPDAR